MRYFKIKFLRKLRLAFEVLLNLSFDEPTTLPNRLVYRWRIYESVIWKLESLGLIDPQLSKADLFLRRGQVNHVAKKYRLTKLSKFILGVIKSAPVVFTAIFTFIALFK